jgi:hypothetical protein
MTERSNVTVLKTVVPLSGTVGSNPTLSVPLAHSIEIWSSPPLRIQAGWVKLCIYRNERKIKREVCL